MNNPPSDVVCGGESRGGRERDAWRGNCFSLRRPKRGPPRPMAEPGCEFLGKGSEAVAMKAHTHHNDSSHQPALIGSPASPYTSSSYVLSTCSDPVSLESQGSPSTKSICQVYEHWPRSHKTQTCSSTSSATCHPEETAEPQLGCPRGPTLPMINTLSRS